MARFFGKAFLRAGIAILCTISGATSVPMQAHASTWGCQVALCLATPGSPTTYAECVPPITKLWEVLSLGGSMPDCSEGGISFAMMASLPIFTVSQVGGATSYYWLTTNKDGTVSVEQLTAAQVRRLESRYRDFGGL